jgi:uncharacterized membrane protein
MSQLLAVAYPDLQRATEVLTILRRLHQDTLADLDEAVYVTRDMSGSIELHQSVRVTGTGAAGGDFWGLLIGLLLSVPLLGGVVGTAADAIGGDLAELGIDERFVMELGRAIAPGNSAIFALVRDTRLDGILDELRPHGGTILWTPLSRSARSRLRAALNARRRA